MNTYTRLFQLLGWIIAVLSTALGIFFVSKKDAIAWDPQQGSAEVFTSRVVYLEPVGLALLSVGILSIVALCIMETLRKR